MACVLHFYSVLIKENFPWLKAVQRNEKHNKEKVTWVNKAQITSVSDGNCEWRRLFSAEWGGKNMKSFSMIK